MLFGDQKVLGKADFSTIIEDLIKNVQNLDFGLS
jgi:hypothetical protein